MMDRQVIEKMGLNQPTVSRALSTLGDQVVRIGAGSAIHYALRDTSRSIAALRQHIDEAASRIARLG